MNAISREEFNARIETIEARMDARVERVHADIREFLGSQTVRDKAIERIQFERDKRYDSMIQGIAIESREALKKAGTVNANVWMATAVHLFGVVSIVVGGYFASQAHLYVAAQTTLAAVQAGKDVGAAKPAELPSSVLPK
ncbi:hypothetical protein CKQ80_24495 [Pseudomonas moraviensis]|uniref:Uncharacterized protein n=2 Tax=Pseudomonas moraviensis TaxID=321662 RepID=A0A2A2PS98_9PSED|nr:hypothetical protein CKQ68_04715 [Pseudomonas moraviensis]PAW58324.1 hypothetical protein CKQ80_24495 [Pseudomonas moraviensis]